MPPRAPGRLHQEQRQHQPSVYFDAGTYNISFLAAQRVKYQTQNQQIEVVVDSTPVDRAPIPLPGQHHMLHFAYQTSNFTVTAGAHTVEFLGMTPSSGDSTAFIDDVAISDRCAISDGSFESRPWPRRPTRSRPPARPGNSRGSAGVSTNDSGFTAGNPNAPDGNQVAFIKDTGSISQSVYMAAGIYNISFMAAQRYTTTRPSPSRSRSWSMASRSARPLRHAPTYGLYETSNFTVTAGLHTIQFVGVEPDGRRQHGLHRRRAVEFLGKLCDVGVGWDRIA